MTTMRDQQDRRRSSDPESRKGWQVTAIVAVATVFIQVAGWVWWFGGWKSTTDLRISNLENTFKSLPDTVNSIRVDQRIMSTKLDNFLSRDRRDSE